MLFFVVHVISFERSPDCFVVYIKGDGIFFAEGARHRERDKEKAIGSTDLGRAIAFVFFAIIYGGFCGRGEY